MLTLPGSIVGLALGIQQRVVHLPDEAALLLDLVVFV
jgi:hypothetical protein